MFGSLTNVRTVEPQVVVALIAAIAALTVSLIQVFSQRHQGRILETLKMQLDRQRTEHSEYLKVYLKMRVDGQERQLQAFKSILQSVQLLRDKLKSIIADPGAFDRKLLKEELSVLAKSVVASYAENQIHLAEPDRLIAHSLKNKCLAITEISNHKGYDAARELGPLELSVAELQSAFRANAARASDELVEAISKRISEERGAT